MPECLEKSDRLSGWEHMMLVCLASGLVVLEDWALGQ